MTRIVEPRMTFAAVTLSAVLLVGCTAIDAAAPTAETSASAAASDSEAAPVPEPTEPESCTGLSEVISHTADWSWERQGTLRDLGPREFARGTVAFDDEGNPSTYTVESGDVEAVIAERLCAYPGLGSMNHVRTIQPGQVLWLSPDPDMPWVPYHNPMDAEAGFQQIPYQQAIESAGAAVDAGDVDAVRAIWNDTLSGMFRNQDTIDRVQRAVDSGDLDALRQLFS